jgi:membrane associated rhomboid family serine protease
MRIRQSPILIAGLVFEVLQTIETSTIKPVVTITLLFANILPHLYHNLIIFGFNLSDVKKNCLNPRIIVDILRDNHTFPFNRLFLSAFIHVDDIHLYYNMVSLLWKGINLERILGSKSFMRFTLFSLLVSQILYIVTCYLLYQQHFISYYQYDNCVVGFSGVLFSFKYVLSQCNGDHTSIMFGIRFPSKYMTWIELLAISLLTPNVSFVGHLCGILSGIVYMKIEPYVDMSNGPYAYQSDEEYLSPDDRRSYTYASGIPSSPVHKETSDGINNDSEIDHNEVRRIRLDKFMKTQKNNSSLRFS